MNNKIIVALVLNISIVGANSIVAEPAVKKSWPKQLPYSEYNSSNYYGNGQTADFNAAINGSSLTAAEENNIRAILPTSEVGSFYLKLGMHKSTSEVQSIKNKATAAALTNMALTAKQTKKNITSGQIGGGYIFDKFKVDVGYIFGSTLNYNQTTLFTAGAIGLQSKITGQNVIASVDYEFAKFNELQPFVGVAAGLGMNKVAATFTGTGIAGTDGVSKTKTILGLNYGLQVGARLRISQTRFLVNASYRYLNLGKVKWQDNSGTMLLEGKKMVNGIFLDLMYLL